MTSPLVDFNAWDAHRAKPMSAPRGTRYALVADADPQRIDQCLGSIRPFKIEAIVARDDRKPSPFLNVVGHPDC